MQSDLKPTRDRRSIRGYITDHGVPVPVHELYRVNAIFARRDSQGRWSGEELDDLRERERMAELKRRVEAAKSFRAEELDRMAEEWAAMHAADRR